MENLDTGKETPPAELDFIQSIVETRKSIGMTQKELAKKTGISQADISRIENGNANPSLKTLNRLADAMGKTVHIVFV